MVSGAGGASSPMATERQLGSVSIAPLPMASRVVTPLPAFCTALSARDPGEDQREDSACCGIDKRRHSNPNQAVQLQFKALFDAHKAKIVAEHKESGHGRSDGHFWCTGG